MLDADSCEEGGDKVSRGLLAQPRLSLSLWYLGVRRWQVVLGKGHPLCSDTQVSW